MTPRRNYYRRGSVDQCRRTLREGGRRARGEIARALADELASSRPRKRLVAALRAALDPL